jgi:CBS domain-containing protein
MKRISEIIIVRTEVYCVHPDDTVQDAARRMAEWSVRAVTVCDDKQVVGIISNWDFLTKVLAQGRDPKTTTISQVMTSNPMTVTPDASYAECLVAMLDNDFQHLVVVAENGEPRGTVAIGDLLKTDKAERDAVLHFYHDLFTA